MPRIFIDELGRTTAMFKRSKLNWLTLKRKLCFQAKLGSQGSKTIFFTFILFLFVYPIITHEPLTDLPQILIGELGKPRECTIARFKRSELNRNLNYEKKIVFNQSWVPEPSKTIFLHNIKTYPIFLNKNEVRCN